MKKIVIFLSTLSIMLGISVLVDSNANVINASGKATCLSGGEGANSCSVDAGIDILGVGVTTSCSVSCNDGYFACCGVGCYCYPVGTPFNHVTKTDISTGGVQVKH